VQKSESHSIYRRSLSGPTVPGPRREAAYASSSVSNEGGVGAEVSAWRGVGRFLNLPREPKLPTHIAVIIKYGDERTLSLVLCGDSLLAFAKRKPGMGSRVQGYNSAGPGDRNCKDDEYPLHLFRDFFDALQKRLVSEFLPQEFKLTIGTGIIDGRGKLRVDFVYHFVKILRLDLAEEPAEQFLDCHAVAISSPTSSALRFMFTPEPNHRLSSRFSALEPR